jgi:hypothetical protein
MLIFYKLIFLNKFITIQEFEKKEKKSSPQKVVKTKHSLHNNIGGGIK